MTRMTATRKMMDAAQTLCRGEYEQARTDYAERGTEESRHHLANKYHRAKVAANMQDDSVCAKLASKALSIHVRRQLNAHTTDNYKKLDGIRRLVAFIESDGQTSVQKAWLEVIAAITSSTSYVSISSLQQRIQNNAGTGPLDKTPIRNALGALHLLGLLETDTPDSPRYIQKVAAYRFRPIDSELYGSLRHAAKQALKAKQKSVLDNYLL